MSYLKQVMEMLGLKVLINGTSENFEMNEVEGKFYISENGLFNINIKEDTTGYLNALLTGEYTIKREWKPKEGDMVYTIIFDKNGEDYLKFWWNDSVWQRNLLERGLVFQTKEEAIECAKKMLEAIKND